MNNPESEIVETVGIKALGDLLSPPQGAYVYIKRFIVGKDLNPSQVAKVLGVSSSTMTRLLDGGRLTTNMAAKLYQHFAIDPDILFNLEAKHLAQEY